MSTQDDDLKLEPPQDQRTPPTQPPAPASPPPPPAPVYSPPGQPAPAPPAEGDSGGLEPGAGKPLVEGPPMSVGAPVSDASINRTAAFFGIGLLGVGVIVALVLLLVIVFAVCHH